MSNFDNTNNNEEITSDNEIVLEPIVETKVEDIKEEIIPQVDTVEEKQEVINAAVEGTGSEPQVLGNVFGAIGTTTKAPTQEPKKSSTKKAKKEDTVAIHSTKNVTWPGVGKVYVGYNIVGKEESEKWLTRSHIRIATPEEVAREFGK